MAGFKIRFEVRELRRRLSASSRRARRMRPVWKEIGDLIEDSIDKNFAQQGRPKRWAPWAASTAARRAGGRILDETGALIASITKRVSNRGVEVGSDLPYAAIHNFGGSTGRAVMPQREFAMVQTEDEIRIADLIEDFTTEPLRR